MDKNFRMDLKRGLVLSDGEIASNDALSTYDNNNTRKIVTKYIEDCYVISDLQRRPAKKPKLSHKSPVLIGHVNTRLESPHVRRVKILLDLGRSSSLIVAKYVRKLHLERTTPTLWMTKGGTFKTSCKCTIQFSLPELFENRLIKYEVLVLRNLMPMI